MGWIGSRPILSLLQIGQRSSSHQLKKEHQKTINSKKALYSNKNISSCTLNLCKYCIHNINNDRSVFESNEASWEKAKREMPSSQNETNQILYISEKEIWKTNETFELFGQKSAIIYINTHSIAARRLFDMVPQNRHTNSKSVLPVGLLYEYLDLDCQNLQFLS